jgi:hypothetical protein
VIDVSIRQGNVKLISASQLIPLDLARRVLAISNAKAMCDVPMAFASAEERSALRPMDRKLDQRLRASAVSIRPRSPRTCQKSRTQQPSSFPRVLPKRAMCRRPYSQCWRDLSVIRRLRRRGVIPRARAFVWEHPRGRIDLWWRFNNLLCFGRARIWTRPNLCIR